MKGLAEKRHRQLLWMMVAAKLSRGELVRHRYRTRAERRVSQTLEVQGVNGEHNCALKTNAHASIIEQECAMVIAEAAVSVHFCESN